MGLSTLLSPRSCTLCLCTAVSSAVLGLSKPTSPRVLTNDSLDYDSLHFTTSGNITAAQDLAQQTGTLDPGNISFTYAPTYAPNPNCSFTLPIDATSLSQSISSSVTIGNERQNLSAPLLDIAPNPLLQRLTTYDPLSYRSGDWYSFGNLSLQQDCKYTDRYDLRSLFKLSLTLRPIAARHHK